MKTIHLAKGKQTLVDDGMFEFLDRFAWYCGNGYAVRGLKIGKEQTTMSLHHYVLPKKDGFVIDHINRDKLDNRRENLRYATKAQNRANSPPGKNNTSGYKGLRKSGSRWTAQALEKGKFFFLGVYKTKQEAALAYNAYAVAVFGEFAWLNPVALNKADVQ